MFQWLSIAVIAQIVLGSAVVFDKILLRRHTVDAWSYSFWFGILGLFSLLLLPFSYRSTALPIIVLALISGGLFFASTFFFFWALERIEASAALPLLGALSPLGTLFLGWYYLGTRLGFLEALGFCFLVATGVLLFLAERRELRHGVFWSILASSFLLAASHVGSKLVFTETSFVTGFFWIKMGGVLCAVFLLLVPRLRRLALYSAREASSRSRLFYFINRSYASVGSLLVSGAIYLSDPALVDATQNIRYVVIFLLAWIILGEKFRGRILVFKIAALALMTIGLGWLTLGEYVQSLPPILPGRPITWGVTFSEKFSTQLGLDWQKNYLAILDGLHPARLRLAAYWDQIESMDNQFDFTDLDWQVGEAENRHIPIILTVGMKVLRWPECHIPAWAGTLDTEAQQQKLEAYIKAVLLHYRNNPAIERWQVENEAYLSFGICPPRANNFLQNEISLVKSLDPTRAVLVTDSGEVGEWLRAAKIGDIFGTSIYRKVYPRLGGALTGVIEYPLAPEFFRVKEKLVRWINHEPTKPFIVHELQAEPWFHLSLGETPYEEQLKGFSPEYFRATIDYAEQTGFDEYYFWGAEWWYWVKEKHANPAYWDIAKSVLELKPARPL